MNFLIMRNKNENLCILKSDNIITKNDIKAKARKFYLFYLNICNEKSEFKKDLYII